MNKSNKLNEVEQGIVDSFVTCPHCQSQLCYHQDLGEGVEVLTCLSCGFTTSNQMQEGSETEKAVSARHPRLYKDLRFKDQHGYVWYPSVVTSPGVGMVYIDGSSTEDWEWASTPMRKLTRKEKRSGMFAKGEEYIAVPNQTKHFGKDGFVQAMASIGLFGNED